MPGYFNKDKLKEQLEITNIFDLLVDFGAEPEYYNDDTLVSATICHNHPGEGSHKLYYYANTKLFRCYTSCDTTFDIFELAIKVAKLQRNQEWELYDAMEYIANYFGIEGERREEKTSQLADWGIFERYKSLIKKPKTVQHQLNEYNPLILTRFCYPRISCWEDEGIDTKVCKENLIGYYPGMEQITIPHFDINNRLVGIRGRFLAEDDANRWGKYRPLTVNHQTYNHPLSMNLYNLNNSKKNIGKARAAICFEGEKSALKYRTMFGKENDISVACCGSSISSYQIDLLRAAGADEIIIAFDRQFQKIGDDEFYRLTTKLKNIHKKYSPYVKISAIFDKEMITDYKASPIDKDKETFLYLLERRITPS